MIYRFGAFCLDTARYELRRDDVAVAAEPKVLEALAFLVEQRHRVVTKEELIEEVWRGQFVTDSAVSRAIREARKALGDSAAASSFVKTVYGRGFAFVAAVEAFSSEAPARPPEREPALPEPPSDSRAPIPTPLTPLIGRDREVHESCEALGSTRLLTLTGPGGAGKTRLAIEIAHRCAPRFGDGAVFVPLVDVERAESVASTIGRALDTGDAAGGSSLDALRLQIGSRELLLVLDNFEQVVDAADAVGRLLEACPNLTVLVTSRFLLQIVGEREFSVAPLLLPEAGALASEQESSPAVELFLERARAVRRDFRPEGRDLDYVAEICRRLDGLPLAIELAAARIKLLDPADLWRRLAERSDLLSAPTPARPHRHHTLELALSWSYDLLAPGEKALLQSLTVFAGGCPLTAAERVCCADGEGGAEVLDTLAALVDKSLVQRLPGVGGELRFGLLETTRAFARAQLDEERLEALRRSHASWVLDLAQQGEPHLAGGDQEGWLQRFDAEYGNLQAALSWARSKGDLAIGLATAAALARYWSARGTYREGREELEELLSGEWRGEIEPVGRADALVALGLICLLLCDYPASRTALEEAMTILRQLGDRQRLAHALNHLGWVVAQGADTEQAEVVAREALELQRALDNPRGVSVALNNLGSIAMYKGDVDRAEECFSQSVDERRAAEDERGVAFALTNLAILRLHLTDRWDEVPGWLAEARELVDRLDDVPIQGWVLCAEGALAIRQGAPEEAKALLEESSWMNVEHGHHDGRAWCLIFLAKAHRDCGEIDRARQLLREVGDLWTELRVPWGAAVACRDLARLSHSAGDLPTARNLYRQSLELFESYGAEAFAEACRRALSETDG